MAYFASGKVRNPVADFFHAPHFHPERVRTLCVCVLVIDTRSFSKHPSLPQLKIRVFQLQFSGFQKVLPFLVFNISWSRQI